MPHRTTRADLARLIEYIERDSKAIGLLAPSDALTLISPLQPGKPYRLNVRRSDGHTWPFVPADGDAGAIGKTPKESARTLKVMYDTLRAVRQGRGV